ncbi:hypothetical protein A6U86_29450 [Rhizobium sp. AC27/96]|uniref:YfbU family protein n=1 Tax=Rhizobium sp. AC27/96 TaxID=1841653 RepID=UPI0008278AB0|nr:YfbU family protein [Rhizobium sp. AC27/96]OCJ05386.1 hypothetical protein A6U86_29450 [Rhizobium sp. AC27/96]
MISKTERFEMRLDQHILDRLDEWRSAQGDLLSRAEAVRRLVDAGLSSSGKEFNPTSAEKLMLWLLTEQLKHTKGYENAESIKLIQDSIYAGQFWAIEWEMSGIFFDHSGSRKALPLVTDTMTMWTFIERAYAGFSEADKTRIETEIGLWARDPKFDGFDGNTEGEYMQVANFLLKNLGRYEEFRGRSMNSHTHRVSQSRRMVSAFRPMLENLRGRELNVDEVIKLLQLD